MKYSFIVPAYNEEKYIEECIDSILNQYKFNELCELFIIDDKSTDNSSSIIDKYTSNNIHIIHKEHEGVSAARNLGLDLATGDFICFVDSDDYLSEDYLSIIDEYIDLYNLDCIAIQYTHDESELYQTYKFKKMPYQSVGNFFSGTCNFITKREYYKDIRFPNIPCEDTACSLLPVVQCKSFGYITGPLYFYRDIKGSRSEYGDIYVNAQKMIDALVYLVNKGKELGYYDMNPRPFVHICKIARNYVNNKLETTNNSFNYIINTLIKEID